jgi:hypothetical protein
MQDPTAIYRFTDADGKRIPSYRVGDRLQFKSADGSMRSFLIQKVDTTLQIGSGAVTTNLTPQERLTYEQKSFRILALPDSSEFTLFYERLPMDVVQASLNRQVEFPAHMTVGIIPFPYWNGRVASGEWAPYLDLTDSARSIMNINGRVYQNAVKIRSGYSDTLTSLRSVNTLYYVDGTGIVGFDDVIRGPWVLQ